MPRTRSSLSAAAALAALAVAGPLVLTPGSASAARADAPTTRTLADGLLSPLSLAVAHDGTRYVSENFKGTLLRQRPGGEARVVFQEPRGREVGAVSTRGDRVTFAVSDVGSSATLRELRPGGRSKVLADLYGYEARVNPDSGVTYGIDGIDPACAAQFPEDIPASYTGAVDSHPYASYTSKKRTYVADAGANAVLAVGKRGRVSTVAVLPRVGATITADVASAFGMPDCAVGETYYFESVPTDVEQGPRGLLYVTTLPGGPEDGSLGPLAKVYRVNPTTGRTVLIAGDMVSATGLAVTGKGDVYVAQLFPGVISRIKAGTSTATPYLSTPLPADVEVTNGRLFATGNVLSGTSGEPGDVPAGTLLRIRR